MPPSRNRHDRESLTTAEGVNRNPAERTQAERNRYRSRTAGPSSLLRRRGLRQTIACASQRDAAHIPGRRRRAQLRLERRTGIHRPGLLWNRNLFLLRPGQAGPKTLRRRHSSKRTHTPGPDRNPVRMKRPRCSRILLTSTSPQVPTRHRHQGQSSIQGIHQQASAGSRHRSASS